METLEKSFQDKALSFVRANFLILALFSVGLIFLGIGVIQLIGSNKTQIEFEKGEGVVDSASSPQTGSIKVDVSGQVEKPGVYELPAGARIQDALIAAGGLGQGADREYVEKAINLAQKVGDGAKIYIPRKDEKISASQIYSGGNQTGGSVIGIASDGLISINNASASELDRLPGIGPVTAGKIIDGRPYGSIQELLEGKVVGQATYEKIKDQISL